MKFGFSFVTLASAAVLALTAGMAQARPGNGEGQSIAKAQAVKAAEAWHQAEARLFEGMTPSQIQHLWNQFQKWHQFQRQTIQRSQPASASIVATDEQLCAWLGMNCDAEYLSSVNDASPPNPPPTTYNDGAGT